MVELHLLVMVGVGSVVAGIIAFRSNAKLLALILGCFGLLCLACLAIMVLALAHFGEVPRH